MEKLLTQKDVAERWQLTVRAIENCRKTGTITPVKGIPGIRFSLRHIEDIEATKLERFSPLERRRLESEIVTLKHKLSIYEDARADLLRVTSKIINL